MVFRNAAADSRSRPSASSVAAQQQRLGQFGQPLLIAAQASQRAGEVDPEEGRPRRQGDGSAHQFRRLGGLSPLQQHHAQQMAGLRAERMLADRLAAGSLGFRQPPAAAVLDSLP